ncbi:MAG: hypothetical protein KF764_18935 [Labilithrix sp.]|nr:hypothetical protein [Labilithrix sp.]
MRWARAAAVGGIVTSVTTVARAEAPPALPLELAWDAPAGCPDAAFVTARVEAILRGPPAAPVAVVARGTVERAGAAYHLALTLRTGDLEETRAFDAATCAALAEAAAVVVALAIDPSRDDASTERTPPPEPTPAPEAPPPPPAARPKRNRSPTSPRPPAPISRVALGLGGALGLGALPEASGAVLVSGTLRLERVRVGLLGSVTMPVSATFDRSAGATFHQLEAGAFGSYLVPIGPVAIGPAANLELSHVRVRGFGIREPKLSTTFWPTAVVGARLEAKLASRLGLFSRADALFPIAAPAFSLATPEGSVRLHEPGLPALRLSLGLEIVLP